MSLSYFIHRVLIRRCKHHPENVVADILDGDFHGGPGGDQSVEWCRTCGSYRRVFDTFGPKLRYGDWRCL